MMRNCAVLFALVLVALAVALAGLQVGVASAAEAPLQVSADRHGPDALLVKMRAGVTADQTEATLRRHGAAAARRFQPPRSLPASPIGRWWHVRLAPGTDLRRTLNRLAGDPAVERTELDYEVRINLTPNDPSFSQLWGLNNIGQTGGTSDADVDAPEAWDLQTGKSEVLVAVIDTGVDYTHPDLAANVWTNPGEIPGNGLDDDGNGYVDDVHGYDFANNDADPFDDHGHGTHVSGTIAAVGNNGIGVAGVNWAARIMAVKFLGAGGSGSTSGAINAILYAAGMGARVMNNSWGGGGFSQALMDAITTADNAGALFVAAAGNSGSNNDATPNYPSNYDVPNVLAVAATDHTDAKASFSSYGATTVDLGAPGVSIYSTVPASGALCCSDPSGYKLLSGTSMATPHVSGAAALVFAQFPGITHHQVKARLMGAADPVPSLAGITVTGGRLNAVKSLENDLIEPAAVTDLAVSVVGSRSVTLTWTATGDDGTIGTASSYDLRYATAPITDAAFATATRVTAGVPAPGPAGTAQSAKVAGLEPGTAYYFALEVVDNVGNVSLLSNVPTATTQAVAAVFSDDLEAGGGNWTVTGSDGVGGPALWHLSAHRASSPTTAFYYGREATLTYNTGAANSGAITSGPISLSGTTDPTLTFRHFLATENYPAPVFDVARVEVSGDGGLTWQALLVTSTGTAGAMVSQAVDLSAYGGKVIQVRFRFDTGDAALNDFEGWVVDDVAVTVTVPPGTPAADPGGPYAGAPGTPILFDGAGSSDPEGSPLTYAWTFGDGTTGVGVTPSHTYVARGTYTVTLVVNDGTLDSPPATTRATVNRAPTASAAGPYSGFRRQVIVFDGSGSIDLDGDALTYAWTFGDGATGAGVSPGHAYSMPGTYTVTLVVSDGMASSTPATTTVTVVNRAPTANAGGPYAGEAGVPISFNGLGSSDPDGDPLTYSWTFGDGAIGAGPTPSHTYGAGSTYTVTLVVSDGVASSAPATTTATVVLDAIPPAAVTDLTVTAVGARTATLTWTATGDDGTIGTASSYDLRYATAPITDATFATATRVTAGVPAPGPAGTVQSAKVAGLEPGTAYYFALEVVDNVGNVSLLSNVPAAATNAVVAVFSDNLEAGGGNWTVTGSDGVGGPALWHLSAHRASSPTTAFYYGREATLTYNTGARNFGAITSGPISLSGTTDPTLTFRHFLATENYPAPVFDVARVEASGDGGLTWQALLVISTGTAGAMVSQAVDLSAYGGKVIQVRFSFDTGDAALNDFEGWVVDDVAVTVAAVNGAPTASPGGPYSGFKRQAIVLDGSGSSDPDGSALTYAWDFGDGTTGTGVAPTHAYAAAGTYKVTLVVNDGTASSTPATTTVTVANRAPTANPGGPYAGVVGNPVAFTGAGSSDPDGDPLTYGWDFGDGTTGTGVNPTHVYGAGGTFTATLIVNDGAASSGPATTTVAVNQPPVANAGPDQTVKQRTTATLNGTASSDPDGSIVGYAWTQVSGTPVTLSGASSAVATFTAPDLVKSIPVVLVFELAVTDDRGARAADQVAVTVSVK